MLIGFLVLILLLTLGIWGYLQHPKFGKAPSGERLLRIENSKNYRDGQFHNLNYTPQLAEGYTIGGVLWDFLFTKYPDTAPMDSIPSVKTDLKKFKPEENVLVWMGHSSYFIQLNGTKYLMDPVLSGNASPLPTTKAFPGADVYKVEDIPEIDYLLISHDHYDHLDYETIKALIPKVGKIITGLGVGAHLEHWGYDPEIINEMDWDETISLNDSTQIHSTAARHFSGRTLKRNNTLWLSFVLETPDKKLFLGGDSGYDSHFVEIGNKYGPFDWVILENGQYDPKWKYIHLLPEETVKAAKELKAKRLVPVHNSKFKLGNHTWFDPLERVVAEATNQKMPILTPKIGEIIWLDAENQPIEKWWKDLR